ncbi:SnoaL-like domain-containing protein [Planctomonas sp. JC2975]|uniref:nuclear transport factor 2 family protein n=1 Tax=Planctomonas sp. JC2975 TaxID=2729626 RepID=UPI0014731180|nr:nuclear transport factor 2 family protein [Planctomonas sp. JC2975]NNC10300.1 SnoaL-like domain-containing protein [Planctomonas sp. JC2975]
MVSVRPAEHPDALERLVDRESLRELQARFCRYVAMSAWDDLDRLFAPAGQIRAYGDDGELVCFADAPHIGSTLAERYSDAVLVLTACLEELTIHTPHRAEGVWAFEHLAVRTGGDGGRRRANGRGYVLAAYERDGAAWRIRSLEFTRLLLELGEPG